MQQLKKDILDCLHHLKGSGKFASIHTSDFVFPGLAVEGVGEIAYPVNEFQARVLIQSAHKAPFGKGSHTIVDSNVRSAWEIDAGKLSFSSPAWENFLKKIISNIKNDLGIEDYKVAAHLYKLLIYEVGDFFLPHKDTEKEKGMFGTLIIGLPSQYTGGKLVIHFEGEKEVASFSDNAARYAINYAAFYADCDHEVKPLTSGYRVCLVYNLIQQKAAKKIELQSLQSYAGKLAEIFTAHQSQNATQLCIVLLGHQYTPENFSLDGLKLNDRAKAEALLLAAQKAGYYAKMCLVTSYLSGAPEDDGYYEYGKDGGDDDAQMAEVFDKSLYVEHWLQNELPALDNVPFTEDELITSFALDDDEPIIKESTGYMGNYGPDLMHWYHYGAVMIWPPQVNAQLLLSQNTTTQLNWVDYFNRKQKISDAEIPAVTSIILTGLNDNQHTEADANFNAIADWLICRREKTFLLQLPPDQLQKFFNKIDAGKWINVFKFLPAEITGKVLEKVTEEISLPVLEKLLAVLRTLALHGELYHFAIGLMAQLPKHFKMLYTKTKNQINASAIADLFWIEKNLAPSKTWIDDMAEVLIEKAMRQYIHDVLAPQLLIVKDQTEFTGKLLQFCREYLQALVNNQPKPPANWSRSLPDTTENKKIWQLLKVFLESADQQIFDYRKNQNERTEMEYAIKKVIIDLKTETIKKGSPHTLRITKTQATYQRQMKDWNKDLALLDKVMMKN
ncbi:MAG: 2OG-Fe(II) oxygenase [Chitinophagaceae bacterium]